MSFDLKTAQTADTALFLATMALLASGVALGLAILLVVFR